MDFAHHPDPAIGFCIEVEELEAIMIDRENGFPNPDDADLERRIDLAMSFCVGGDPGAIAAKDKLREIEDRCIKSLARFASERSAKARDSRNPQTSMGDAS